ncbi:hypothetical protein AN218_18570 [Streptomyces nanshensis]|uniref:Uncharacterized protein n=2 Tax=Streptomyces nanshensis TaxID=518642 RepID=A0A1E7L208_9ACTN|nr:hypothetical protein AN218_18570 [Streptomyces nanshensis]
MLAQRPASLRLFGPDDQEPDHRRGSEPTPTRPHITGEDDEKTPAGLPKRKPFKKYPPKKDGFVNLASPGEEEPGRDGGQSDEGLRRATGAHNRPAPARTVIRTGHPLLPNLPLVRMAPAMSDDEDHELNRDAETGTDWDL